MSAETKRIEAVLETLIDSVALAEAISLRICREAGFEEEDCHLIAMAVREGVINAVQYGNREQREKKIYLAFELKQDKLEIHVLDQGRGFNLAEVPDPLAEENLLKTSGRGIFLMRSFMDEFAVRRDRNGGAEVIMAKRYPSLGSTHPPTGSAQKGGKTS